MLLPLSDRNYVKMGLLLFSRENLKAQWRSRLNSYQTIFWPRWRAIHIDTDNNFQGHSPPLALAQRKNALQDSGACCIFESLLERILSGWMLVLTADSWGLTIQQGLCLTFFLPDARPVSWNLRRLARWVWLPATSITVWQQNTVEKKNKSKSIRSLLCRGVRMLWHYKQLCWNFAMFCKSWSFVYCQIFKSKGTTCLYSFKCTAHTGG